jgi:hypothetical protein
MICSAQPLNEPVRPAAIYGDGCKDLLSMRAAVGQQTDQARWSCPIVDDLLHSAATNGRGAG